MGANGSSPLRDRSQPGNRLANNPQEWMPKKLGKLD
jgi:hypothetical protein